MRTALPSPLEPVVPTFPVKRWTADQYLEMIRTGILSEDDRVELIDGIVVPMPPSGPGHNRGVAKLNRLFRPTEETHYVLVQGTIRISDRSVCDPDIAIVQASAMEAEPARHPNGSEVDLVVEVADSSLRQDRENKAQAYSEAGVAEYWVAYLQGRVVWVHRGPGPNGYRSVTSVNRDERLSPERFPDLTLLASDFLPG